MRLRSYFRTQVAAFLVVCLVACAARNGQAAIVFQNGNFVAVEAEDADRIVNTTSGWVVATIGAPVAQSKETPAIDILPATSNASGGAALFHQYGASEHAGQAIYRFKFSETGDYKFYLRSTSFESNYNADHWNEDSLFRPTGFNMAPDTAFGTGDFVDGTYDWITNGPSYTVTAADVAAPFVEFRLDTWEDGFSFDRLVLSKTTTLNATQLDALTNSRQGVHVPFVYYSFESPDVHTDGFATDFSGRHRDGTLSTTGTGSYSYQTSAPAVLAGTQSLRLNEDGNNNAARLSLNVSTSELDFSNDSWTFSGWYNRADTDTNDFIFHLGHGDGFGGGHEFYLYGVEGSTNLALHSYYNDPQNVNLTVAGAATAGTWRHVALVHDSDAKALLLYVDGVLAGTDTTFALALPQSSWTVHFGGHDDPGFQASRWFNGNLDDLALFNRVLSPSMIEALATGRLSPLEVPEPGALLLLAAAALLVLAARVGRR
ncbi:MAG: LamG domain-containing protein [Patescibacteria group bacterium]|nr:LamG domain-containing protein [Patescibacteria group bacterium]